MGVTVVMVTVIITLSMSWTQPSSSGKSWPPCNEAEGAPLKKYGCGVVAHSNGGEEQLCVFGGCGPLLNSASHQTTAEYVENTSFPGMGWTIMSSTASHQVNIHSTLCNIRVD